MNRFDLRVGETSAFPNGLRAGAIRTVQVNIGLTCNLECAHCHVASSPRRKEQMSRETLEQVLRLARGLTPVSVDITGGAPELNPHFRRFVEVLRGESFPVMVRTNLTILLEPDYIDLPEFFRNHRVHLIASLPCYLEENVDRQRGVGVYRKSIEALRRLNALGYGKDSGLPLDLVYNPVGPALPPDQRRLEADYREQLGARHGIVFNRLLTITNMPVGQFLGDLKRSQRLDGYLRTLEETFNPGTVEKLMCRGQVSIGWDGTLYDCDFNLALRLPLNHGQPNHVSRVDPTQLAHRMIRTGEHCFGCTAGSGSSCGGALSA
ncbi:MAG: arsenosugar biosynthesis radical SAM protein ArsS [Candidatus Omnitrophica bacterium]|nr:hypothetical protein [bacterium]NUN96333.1 arsenosugar biosynthesis radical SAM protein ArsS [Candidatus Omnitrophota bacterium]